MTFLRGSAQIEVLEREKKKKKKIKLALNHTESPCTCCLWRKRTPRRIKWGFRTMISAIWVKLYMLFKVSGTIDALMCANTLFFFLFYFIYQNTTVLLEPTDYYKKTIIKLLISSWMHAFRILNIKAI
jgi:hypothetical protein